MDGEVHRRESDIIEYPENYEEMKKKYLDREEEKKKVVMARLKASESQLEELATRAIKTRADRASSDHKTLKDKDRTIVITARSPEVIELEKKLEEEINVMSQRILSELPKEAASLERKGEIILKGRVTKTPPTAPPAA